MASSDVFYSLRFYLDFQKGAKAQAAQQSSNSSSFVIGLTTGILGVVSLYVEDQSKGLFHAYQAWIAFCIIGLIPVRYETPNYHNINILRLLLSSFLQCFILLFTFAFLLSPWLVKKIADRDALSMCC